MPRGSITDQDVDFVETWENIAPHQNAIIRLTPRGDERQELISGRRSFMITTQERIITEDRVHDVANNPFRNGAFRPITVPDDMVIEQNPNALSDEDIFKIFGSSDIAWAEWMGNIDSISTLRRMLDLAEGYDDLTMKRFRQIEARLIEVRGTDRVQITTNDPQLQSFLSDRPSGGQPGAGGGIVDGAANPRRGQGGRSSDYR